MEKKPHILCIDDDDKIRELLSVFLKKIILGLLLLLMLMMQKL